MCNDCFIFAVVFLVQSRVCVGREMEKDAEKISSGSHVEE